jgi:ABC-type amino acid transport substrate-binding protein
MKRAQRHWTCASLAVALVGMQLSWAGSATAGTIDKIRAERTIRLAYREDAPPFSYKEGNSAEPTGFMINLCRAVAKKLGEQLGVAPLKIDYVPVTAANRFDVIKKGDADLLCEATSATLSRRGQVDFSIATFVDGASVIVAEETIRDLKDLAGKKIGVLTGTTTEDGLRATLKANSITAEVVPAKTHAEGIAMLDDGKVSAYFADRSILLSLLKDIKTRTKLGIANQYLSIEPYALALAHGDEEFRLAVDTALSHIYRSSEIMAIFEQSLGTTAKPSDTVKALYMMSALPD